MSRQLDDLQLDAELRQFLQLRASDVARVREAEAMSLAIAAGTTAGAHGRAVGRATWLVLAAALLAIAAIAAIGVGGLRQTAELGPKGKPANGLIAYDALTSTSSVLIVRPGDVPRQITGDAPGAFALSGVCPAFSPDGTMLAFGSEGSTITVVSIDGTGEATVVRRLPDPDGSQHCPAWAPDSAAVGFLAGNALVILPLEGAPVHVTDWPGEPTVGYSGYTISYPGEHSVRWSPDGSMIAVARPSGTWLVPADGGTPRRLDPTPARSVSWSPDGRRLVVNSGTVTTVIDAAGGAAPTSLPLSGIPVWSPLGDRIAGSGDGASVVTVRPDGSDPRIIDDYGYAISWSPDGDQLLYVQDGGDGYVVLTAAADGTEQPAVVVPSVRIRCCRSYPSTDSLSWQPVYDAESDRVLRTTPGPTETLPTPSPLTATPAAQPRLAGRGPVFRWTRVALDEPMLKAFVPPEDLRSHARVAWLGDRFVLGHDVTEAFATSADGRSWTLVAADDPLRALYARALTSDVEVTRFGVPLSSRLATSFVAPPADGTLGAVGFGPAGVVARTHSALDFDAFITTKLGPGWVDVLDTLDFTDGVLYITTHDGRSTELVWADEGFEPGDVADRGFGWYSADGNEWVAIPDFPPNVSEIVGVTNGFIVRGADRKGTGIWHSSDGLTWRRLGGAGDGALVPWADGVIETDAVRRFDQWTATGELALPMAEQLPETWTASEKAIGAGPLGVVTVGIGDRTILFSRDGTEWSLQAMPDPMVMATRGRPDTNVAVGDDVVVVLARAGANDASGPAIWLGTLEP